MSRPVEAAAGKRQFPGSNIDRPGSRTASLAERGGIRFDADQHGGLNRDYFRQAGTRHLCSPISAGL